MSDKYGPKTAEVEAFLALLSSLTAEQWVTVRNTYTATRAVRGAAWDAAWGAAWGAAYNATHAATHAAFGVAYAAACAAYAATDADTAATATAADAAHYAARALVVRDLLDPEHFDVLTAPFRAAGIDFDNLIQTPAPDQAPPFSSASGAGSQQVDRENQAPPAPGVDPAGTPAPSAPVQRSLTPGAPSPTLSSPVLGVGDGAWGETVECVHCEFTITAPNAVEGYQRMSSHYDVEHRYTVDDARWVG